MALPEGVDWQTVVDNIMMTCGHTPLYHPDPVYMKYYIPVWSKKKSRYWERMLLTINADYDPLVNYERNDSYADLKNRNDTTDSTNEVKVSADNSSEYQPDTNNIGKVQSSSKDDITHTGKSYGVTGGSRQDLIKQEREVSKINIYDVIAEDFKSEFCLHLY